MPAERLTAVDVFERLRRAAQTLRRLPHAKGPQGHRTQWPEYVRDGWLAYGSQAANDDLKAHIKVLPSPEDIDAMDEAIPWLQLVDDDDTARAIWARANRAKMYDVARMLGVSKRTAERRLKMALIDLARAINEDVAA